MQRTLLIKRLRLLGSKCEKEQRLLEDGVYFIPGVYERKYGIFKFILTLRMFYF